MSDEKADIGVTRRHVRIPRMNHQRNAQCFPRFPGEFWPMRSGGGWQRVAANVRKSDTGFLEHGPFGQNAGSSTAAMRRSSSARTFPGILTKRGGTIFRSERGADRILEAEQISTNGGDVRRGIGGHW